MKSLFLSVVAVVLLSSHLYADTVSTAFSTLPDYDASGTMTPREDVLSINLGPNGLDLVGQPGQTVGWSFKINWASNAGDSIVFNGSELTPANEFAAGGKYVDIIGEIGGNHSRCMLAGTEWSSPDPFVPAIDGIGSFTIDPNALPGTTYRGNLNVYVQVFSGSGDTRVRLDQFSVPIEVSVTVASIDLRTQTITFPQIAEKAVTDAAFILTATSDSGLPVTYISMSPDLCTVEEGVATIHEAGDVTIMAIQEGNSLYGAAESVMSAFKIVKNPATVTIHGSMDQSYTGSDKLFTAVTDPAGLTVKWLYNGVETPPRDPGIYVIDAIIDDTDYSGSAKARLLITDNSPAPLIAYSDWLLDNFSAQEIQAGLVTAQSANPVDDGVNNLLKYAFGQNAKVPMSPEAREALPKFVSEDGMKALVFEMPLVTAGDLIIKIEASDDLTTWQEITRRTRGGNWTGAANVFTGTPNENGDRAQMLVTEALLPETPKRFYRMNIEFAP